MNMANAERSVRKIDLMDRLGFLVAGDNRRIMLKLSN
jgi:hypothetical protein